VTVRWPRTPRFVPDPDNSSDYLNDILVELELLASEVSYALSSVNVADDEVHAFFKRLSEQIYRLRRSSVCTHDQVKYLGNCLLGDSGALELY
jgi:hypothetical protein